MSRVKYLNILGEPCHVYNQYSWCILYLNNYLWVRMTPSSVTYRLSERSPKFTTRCNRIAA